MWLNLLSYHGKTVSFVAEEKAYRPERVAEVKFHLSDRLIVLVSSRSQELEQFKLGLLSHRLLKVVCLENVVILENKDTFAFQPFVDLGLILASICYLIKFDTSAKPDNYLEVRSSIESVSKDFYFALVVFTINFIRNFLLLIYASETTS